MTLQNLINLLINKGVVHKIGEDYLLTSHFESSVESLPEGTQKLVIKNVEVEVNLQLYPEEIRKSSKVARMTALMNYCKLPTQYTTKDGYRYMIRTSTKAGLAKLDKIINDENFKPYLVIETIVRYYKTMTSPKGFSNFIVQDFDSFYLSIVEKPEANTNKGNTTSI